jgi:prepilin-type processing-associated H-X9-DG protein
VTYNGGIETGDPLPGTELAIAEEQNLSTESYLLNSIFTHKSCRYATEGVLSGFASDAEMNSLPDQKIIMFSERNSEGFSDPDAGFYSPGQDDYDTWAGEATMVRWGDGSRPDEGWIKYNRHFEGGNYLYYDGHAKWLRWSRARLDQFPDHIVRAPLPAPPS